MALESPGQKKQTEWHEQWSMFQDDELFLFKDWIAPNAIEDFKDKNVLECGCGGGQHTSFVAPFAKRVTAVDLNSSELARARISGASNVEVLDGDIAEMNLGREFDVVFSVGVVHHTDDPDRTVANLTRHTAKGGRLILWVYSSEGNWMVRNFVEPLRKILFRHLSRALLLSISRAITAALYFPIYTVYLLPLNFLPYYEYFQNFRRLSFNRNTLNVFDKLNAPQVQFITRERIEEWFGSSRFRDVHISSYRGVSWRGSGTRL